jgi:hypothetical protein
VCEPDGNPEWNTVGHTNSYSYTVSDTVVSTGADAVQQPDDHGGQLSLVQQWGGPCG